MQHPQCFTCKFNSQGWTGWSTRLNKPQFTYMTLCNVRKCEMPFSVAWGCPWVLSAQYLVPWGLFNILFEEMNEPCPDWLSLFSYRDWPLCSVTLDPSHFFDLFPWHTSVFLLLGGCIFFLFFACFFPTCPINGAPPSLLPPIRLDLDLQSVLLECPPSCSWLPTTSTQAWMASK